MTDYPPLQPLAPIPEEPSIRAAIISRLPTSNRFMFIVGTFGLVIYILVMIQTNPKLLANASYMQFITAIVGVLVLIGNHLFGGTKGGTDVMTAQSAAVIKQGETPSTTTTVATAGVPPKITTTTA
jgi:hypothetical protein